MKPGYEIYETQLGEHWDEIQQGKDFVAEIRELSTLVTKACRVRVAAPPQSLPRGEQLWVKSCKGDVSQPWSMEIIEELDDEARLIVSDIISSCTEGDVLCPTCIIPDPFPTDK